MKKIYFLLLFSGFIQTSFAQRYEYGEPVPMNEDKPKAKTKTHRGGVEGGGAVELKKSRFGAFISPSSCWMKPTANKSDDKLYNVSKGSSQIGFTWGLMMDYYFAENYGIATGFQLNYIGGEIDVTQNSAVTLPAATNYVQKADLKYNIQYLAVPFNLKLRSDELGGGFRIFGQIGISAAIPLSKKATYNVTYSDSTNSNPKTVTGDKEKIKGLAINPILLEMNVGGGIEFAITQKMSFYTGIFFNNGFAPDVTNPKELDLDYKGKFTDGNIRINNIALRLGLFF
ncbi:MAG: outer membrane beta-barrel protein [Bacteroidetes bacterium]|nr:outer membrane beta-barrel protein [Bacteroidota bacterium]